MNAKDLETQASINSKNTISAYTFSNQLTDFHGISSVVNATGTDGIDSVIVRWVPADKETIASDSDPVAYEITLLDACKQTTPSIAAFNNFGLSETQGRLVRTIPWSSGLNSVMIRGLSNVNCANPNLNDGREYFVNVRAVHRASFIDPSKPNLRSELNNRYMLIKTLSSGLASIDYDSSEYKVSPGPGQSAQTSLVASWGSITGVFDHLRLYYSQSGALAVNTGTCEGPTNSTFFVSNQTACKKIADPSATSAVLSDLPSLTNFDVRLVICLDQTCSTNQSSDPGLLCKHNQPTERCNTRTQANLASFNGIQENLGPRRISEIGSLFLQYATPSFENGYFDGFIIEHTTDQAGLNAWLATGSNKPVTSFLTADDYSGDLEIEPYDYTQDSEIEISNIDFTSGETHCFSIYPFLYDADGNPFYDTESAVTRVWRCREATLQGPSSLDFAGFTTGESLGQVVTLNWLAPLNGVFSHYEIFYRDDSGPLSFSDAVIATTVNFDYSTYSRVLRSNQMPNGDNRLTESIYLPDGTWHFGILTYYLAGVGNIIRSAETAIMLTCTVDSNNPNPISCAPSQ